MMYRNRPEKFNHKNELDEHLVFFRTGDPSTWNRDPKAVEIYASLYGIEAAMKAEKFGLVCENTNPVWVGGTFWKGKVYDEFGRLVFELPADIPSVDPTIGPFGQNTKPLLGFKDIAHEIEILRQEIDVKFDFILGALEDIKAMLKDSGEE